VKHAEQRLYSAISPAEFHKPAPITGAADYVVNHAGTKLLNYARDLDENSDLAIGGLDVLVNNIVGSGIGIEPQAKTRKGEPVQKLNQQLRALWLEWARMPDVTRDYTFEELQQLSCRSWLRDGEVFAEFVQGPVRANRGRAIPLCVRAMESEWLPFMLNTPISGRIIHGVEKDEDSIPVAYHFYKQLGDPTYQQYSTAFDTRRVLAETVLHLKFVRRLNQTRGVTIFHGVINRLDDIRDIEDSERIAARISADFTAAIIRNPDMIDMPTNSHEAETGDVEDRFRNRYLEMGPGAVWDSLLPGEDVKGIGLDRPNVNLIEFLADQHRRIAAGIGCSNSSLTKRYDGNYSAQRQELVEQMPSYARMRNQFISDFIRPIYERFVFWAVESGALSVPRNVDPSTISRADYRGPAQPWIDPLKESKAAETDVSNGFKSREMVIRERGYDPELVSDQIAMDTFGSKAEDTNTNEPESSAGDDIKQASDAYGVGVRAGTITPQQADEEHFRKVSGLPRMSDAAVDAWESDGGVRRPITLQSGEAFDEVQDDIISDAKKDGEDPIGEIDE